MAVASFSKAAVLHTENACSRRSSYRRNWKPWRSRWRTGAFTMAASGIPCVGRSGQVRCSRLWIARPAYSRQSRNPATLFQHWCRCSSVEGEVEGLGKTGHSHEARRNPGRGRAWQGQQLLNTNTSTGSLISCADAVRR